VDRVRPRCQIPVSSTSRNRRRAPLRDKSYRRYPVGQEVGHFLRTLRVAGRSKNTLESYETVLCLLTLERLDLQSLEQFAAPSGVDLLYAFLDKYWGDSADATMEQRCRVLASFFGWSYTTERISRDPSKSLVPPRRRPTERRAHELEEIRRIASLQAPRDEAALLLLGRLALARTTCAN
jgi:site-specific recombinase XerD